MGESLVETDETLIPNLFFFRGKRPRRITHRGAWQQSGPKGYHAYGYRRVTHGRREEAG